MRLHTMTLSISAIVLLSGCATTECCSSTCDDAASGQVALGMVDTADAPSPFDAPSLEAALEINGVSPANINDADRASRYDKAVQGLIFENGRVRPNPQFAVPRDVAASRIHVAAATGANSMNRGSVAILEAANAVRLDPQSSLAYTTLGQMLETRGKIAEAAASYATSLAIDPTDSEVHFMLGMAHWKLADMDGAAREFNAALAINPSHGPSLERLAVQAYYANDLETAKAYAGAAAKAGTPVPAQIAEALR